MPAHDFAFDAIDGDTLASAATLLGPDEAPPCEVVRPEGTTPWLLICDHASARIPAALDNLGLDADTRRQHIAWDIGVLETARHLSARFDATLVAAGYSRLVIDANREPGDPTSIAAVSDGVPIPGNQGLDAEQAAARIATFFAPYHRTIARELQRLRERSPAPALISLHSFTPRFQGFLRPWHVGVLWERDRRIAAPLLERLRAHPDICVGDNQPYSAAHPAGYSTRAHALEPGYPHVLLEIRQDLIASTQGAERWSRLIGDALAPILADPHLYTVERTRP